VVEKEFGSGMARSLVEDNPAAVLSNKPLLID